MMPRKIRSKKEPYQPDFLVDENEDSQPTTTENVQPMNEKRGGKKRSKEFVYEKPESDDEDEEDQEDEQPVSSIIHQFGAEIKKTIVSKRRKLEIFAKQCNASREKVDAVIETQKSSRHQLYEEFKKQMSILLGQWENDVERIKESEEKLNSLWNQQMKLLSQVRVVQSQRYKSMKQLHDQYSKSVTDIETSHKDQHKSVTDDLHKELANLQKKFLMDTRNQDMANMRKSLHSMLYQ